MKIATVTAAASLIVICLGRAWAGPPDTVLLEELTWTEFRDLAGDECVPLLESYTGMGLITLYQRPRRPR